MLVAEVMQTAQTDRRDSFIRRGITVYREGGSRDAAAAASPPHQAGKQESSPHLPSFMRPDPHQQRKAGMAAANIVPALDT
ncbi:hypothetical protein GJ744_008438 [Endocarpon pusillum]|uniref:Uncharacterized protein n=1 Tax=Endocarpon pusillum TaxID=364733 RepID=A0A8H7AH63_9EURO|nr:hypothetical protein GJ744_008438 [Endocarpon pusillum]